MRVLMFGWEFPPHNSGGLGTACYGLTKGLSQNGIEVTFVVPSFPGNEKTKYVNMISANNVAKGSLKIININSLLTAYITSEEYSSKLTSKLSILKNKDSKKNNYGMNLFEEVYRYSQKAKEIAQLIDFDVIHAHDWMTYQAGINAKKISGKPLIIHVHATEFDRTGGHPNQLIYEIERKGMNKADLIICVSEFTKQKVIAHYGISEEKVCVVHNAVDFPNRDLPRRIEQTDKIVLFLGRITIQKGPDYFLETAKRVLELEPNVKFIMVGTGDMQQCIIEKAAEIGISKHVLFAGFLTGEDIDRAYQMADLYVMPSISEPFGITPLESMRNGTPVLISKQSGVSEIITHCLKVDFWDIDEMANKILGVLRYNALSSSLKHHGSIEVHKLNWDDSAKKCVELYKRVVGA